MNKLTNKNQEIDKFSYVLGDDVPALQRMILEQMNLQRMVLEQIQQLEFKIFDRMAVLEAKLDEALYFNQQNMPQAIIIEQMDKDTAKSRVLEFIKEHKTSDIIELHKEIKCDIKMLIEILDELSAEGKIGATD